LDWQHVFPIPKQEKDMTLNLKTLLIAGAALIAVVQASSAQTVDLKNTTSAEQQMADNTDAQNDGGWGQDGGKHGGGRHGGRHHGDGMDGGRHGGGQHGGRGMQIIDANNDGVIAADEAASLADHMFNRLDGDSDGIVTEAEFTTPPQARHWFSWGASGVDVAALLEKRKALFAELNVDKNASISKAEFFANAQKQLASADTDKDGKITPWEYRLLPRQ
jgi:EF-hand domain pair/EF hand